MNPKTIRLFMIKIKRSGNCWEWTACKDTNGYGQFRVGKKMLKAHRVAYELFKDDIPIGLTLDHLCRNRGCVNPEHLEPVTQKENTMRGETIAKKNSEQTHCPQGHEYSGKNLYIDTKQKRRCRICHTKHQSKYLKKQTS